MAHADKEILHHQSAHAQWDLVIRGRTSLFDIRFRDIWHYRDLLVLFVRRDFVSFYKQTVLGPLWFFIFSERFISRG